MADSLYPGFVRVEYHSGFGAHTMTLPTGEYDGDISGTTAGSFQTWAGGSIAADDMIDNLIDVVAALFDDDTHFDSATIFTMASPTAAPLPAYSMPLTQVGSATSSVWNKAVQKTLTFRTTAFGISKLTLMDAATNGTFPLVRAGDTDAFVDAVIAEWISTGNAWSGRDGYRPANFIQMSATLNEKLRRDYGLV